jgi:hypothetical protein
MKKSDSPHDTLTPQRKHRKLLKDGSGTEVWPESIEKIFVQGTQPSHLFALHHFIFLQASTNTGTLLMQPTHNLVAVVGGAISSL